MKKVIPLLLVLFVFASFVQSQTFEFYRHSPRIVYGDTSSFAITVSVGYYKNLTSSPQNFKFVRILNDLPGPTWSCSLCAGVCYDQSVDTIPPYYGSPIIMQPNQMDSIDVNITGSTPGMATVVLKAFLESNPGNFITDTFRVQLGTVGIRQISTVVDGYELGQNYPNPYNPVTKINFSVPKSERVSLKVYDILGNEVADLIPYKVAAPGSYSVEFDANSYKLSSGIYYYTLRAGNFVSTKKMILVK
ncbi:MAG TPA: T9SS type A sorting domain-containing protein [Ignavibacteria bacterium]|nr:T9SS type A sorting domain-containing protein [Ignavibacteria bacterium]